jgi:hypothetical protein
MGDVVVHHLVLYYLTLLVLAALQDQLLLLLMNVCVLWAQSGYIPQDHVEDAEQLIYPTPFHSEVAEWHANAQLTISGMP